jgi:uncharacterized membrane protein YhaH (DUF805 family)
MREVPQGGIFRTGGLDFLLSPLTGRTSDLGGGGLDFLGMKIRTFFSLAGRITRIRFWFSLVLEAIALLLLGAVFYVYALSIPGAYENGGPTPFPTDPVGAPLAVLWYLAMAVLLFALLKTCVKRLHDRDKSGWWLLVFAAAPNFITGGAHELVMRYSIPDPVATMMLAVSGVLFLWGVAEMGVLPGDSGDNRFGPSP